MIACVKQQTALMAPSAEPGSGSRAGGASRLLGGEGDKPSVEGSLRGAGSSFHAERGARARLKAPASPPRWREGHWGRRAGSRRADVRLPPGSCRPSLHPHLPSNFPLSRCGRSSSAEVTAAVMGRVGPLLPAERGQGQRMGKNITA